MVVDCQWEFNPETARQTVSYGANLVASNFEINREDTKKYSKEGKFNFGAKILEVIDIDKVIMGAKIGSDSGYIYKERYSHQALVFKVKRNKKYFSSSPGISIKVKVILKDKPPKIPNNSFIETWWKLGCVAIFFAVFYQLSLRNKSQTPFLLPIEHDEEKSSALSASVDANNIHSGRDSIFQSGKITNKNFYGVHRLLSQDYQVPNLDHLHSLAQSFPNKVPHFVGRVQELKNIVKHLQETSMGVINQAVVSSLRGMGKTSLAIEYYLEHHKNYALCYWLNCESLASDWQRLGSQLGVHYPDDMLKSPNGQLAYQDLIKQALIKCQQHYQKPILLVFDNADNVQKLEPYQIKGEGFHHIITSSDQSLWPSVIPLGTLKSTNMPAYWSQALPERQDELSDLLKLSEVLDYYPLALTYAMGYLKANPHESVVKLVADTEHRIRNIEKPDKSAWTQHIGVEATLQKIVETLEQQGPSGQMALQLLKLLSLGAADGVPQLFLQDWMIDFAKQNPEPFIGINLSKSEIEWTFENGLNQLKRYQLVDLEHQQELEGVQVKGHRFLHDYVRRQGFNEDIKDQCLHVGLVQLGTRIADIDLDDIYNQRHYQPWMDQISELLNKMSQKALSVALEDSSLDITLLKAASYFLNINARYTQAEKVYKAVLEYFHRIGVPVDDPVILRAQGHLAVIYQQQNKLDDAEKLYKQVLAAYKRIDQSDDHLETLKVKNNLAIVYFDQNKLDDAEKLFEEILDAYKRIGQSDDHPDTLLVQRNLAMLYQQQNKLDDAEKLYKQVLAAYKRIGRSDDHPETLRLLHNLADLYTQQNRLDDAEMTFKDVLDGYKRIGQSDDHPDTLLAQLNLANVYLKQNKLDDAEKLIKSVLNDYIRIGQSADHPNTLLAQLTLANVYQKQNKLDDAVLLLASLLEGYHRIGQPDDHPETLRARQSLAEIYRMQGKTSEYG